MVWRSRWRINSLYAGQARVTIESDASISTLSPICSPSVLHLHVTASHVVSIVVDSNHYHSVIKNIVVAMMQNTGRVVVEIWMASSDSNCRSKAVEDSVNPVSTVGCDIGVGLPNIVLPTVRKRPAGRKVLIVDTIKIDGIIIDTVDALEDLEPHWVIEPSSIAAMILISIAAFSDMLDRKRRKTISQPLVEVICAVCGTIGICIQTQSLLVNRRVIPLAPVHVVSSLHLLQLSNVDRLHLNKVSWEFRKRNGNVRLHEIFCRYLLGKIWNKLRIGFHLEGGLRIFVVCLNILNSLLSVYCPEGLNAWLKVTF